MEILGRTEGSMVIAMCGIQLKSRKIFTDLKLMLGLNETMDRLAMANSVHWYGHVLRAFYFEVEGQRRPKMT